MQARPLVTNKIQSNTRFTFILSIEESLANSLFGSKESLLEEYMPINWFLEKDLVLDLGLEYKSLYMLHPGVPEFIQFLFSFPNAAISFFSSGTEERNNAFVHKLLVRALGDERYKEVRDSVKISSRDQMSEKQEDIKDKLSKQYKFKRGSKVFDLSIATKDKNSDLNTTVLFDHDDSIVTDGQARNLLKLHKAQDAYFTYHYDNSFFISNQIYYAVGLLLEALKHNPASLADNLFSLQFKKLPDGTYTPTHEALFKDIRYFQVGLDELRKFNPNLEFYTKDSIKTYVAKVKAFENERARKREEKLERKKIKYAALKQRAAGLMNPKNDSDDFVEKQLPRAHLFDKTIDIIRSYLSTSNGFTIYNYPGTCGKSFNMQLLRHFLAAKVGGKDTKAIFSEYNINYAQKMIDRYQGKYSIIFLDFSDIYTLKVANIDPKLIKLIIHEKIIAVFKEYAFLLEGSELNEYDKKDLTNLLKLDYFSWYHVMCGLEKLTSLITKYNQAKNMPSDYCRPILIVDAYDAVGSITPDKTSETDKLFYRVLKDNSNLAYAIFSGRVANQELLANNCDHIDEVRSQRMSKALGFNKDDIEFIFREHDLIGQLPLFYQTVQPALFFYDTRKIESDKEKNRILEMQGFRRRKHYYGEDYCRPVSAIYDPEKVFLFLRPMLVKKADEALAQLKTVVKASLEETSSRETNATLNLIEHELQTFQKQLPHLLSSSTE